MSIVFYRARFYIGNAFDIVGDRRRTYCKVSNQERWVDESFEINLRNHKSTAVEVRVVEHLYRWTNWVVSQKSDEFQKTDAQTIEFRVQVPPDQRKNCCLHRALQLAITCVYFSKVNSRMSASSSLAGSVAVSHPFAAIFWGGLLAGLFDITQAFIGFSFYGVKPFRILQHIAGGIFGARAYQMGWQSATLGLALHFTIAFTAAIVYYLASRLMPVLVDHAVLCGLLYGELVFLFMYFVVLPLSAWGPAKFNLATYITGPIGHTLLVGLPIALCVRRFAP